jgi:hypothetical protein
MTAAQKTAKANFKKAIEYRKKTGVSLKEAFAHVYGKKVGAVKKKAAPKKKAALKKKAAPKKVAKKKVAVKKQTGTSVKYYDKLHQAKPVGKRTTKNPHKYRGKTIRKSTTYTESRANRSDKGVLLGIGAIDTQLIKRYQDNIKHLKDTEKTILDYQNTLKNRGSKIDVLSKKRINTILINKKNLLKELKTHSKELKKLL